MTNDQIEDVEYEEVKEETPEIQQEELTPEQKEKQEKMFRSMIIYRFKGILKDIDNYTYKYNKSLSEIKDEIDNKTCLLTKSRRDFILGYQLDFIQQLIDDMNSNAS